MRVADEDLRRSAGACAFDRREDLVLLYHELGEDHVCPLKETRTHIVFGAGYAHADLWFVGEAGNSYLVRPGQTGDGLTVWIEDERTGKPVGGVRGSADEPK